MVQQFAQLISDQIIPGTTLSEYGHTGLFLFIYLWSITNKQTQVCEGMIEKIKPCF